MNLVKERMDAAESEAKKYNLIIKGLKKARRLERPAHLEAVIDDFLRDELNMTDNAVQFDEAIRNPKDGSVLVTFPSVRIKNQVMKMYRTTW